MIRICNKMARIRNTHSTGGYCVRPRPAYRGVPALSHNPIEAGRTSVRALHPVTVLKIKFFHHQNQGEQIRPRLERQTGLLIDLRYLVGQIRINTVYSDLRKQQLDGLLEGKPQNVNDTT
jgi:hypothetical protein